MEPGAGERDAVWTWRSVRPWVLGALALPLLLLAVELVHDALVYRALLRITRRGGLVLSESDPLPAPFASDAPWAWTVRRWLSPVYVPRASYDVAFGAPIPRCGTGITLAMPASEAVEPSDASLATLPGLAHVHALTVREVHVSDAGLRHLAGLHELDQLTLERLDVHGPGLAHLRGLPLVMLSLHGSPVDDAGLAYLADLPALRHLDLGATRVTAASLAGLARFPALRSVDLGGASIDDDALRELASLPALEWLDLADTDVSEQGLAELERLPALRYVNLCHTRVTGEEAARSRSAAVREWVFDRTLYERMAPGHCPVKGGATPSR
jgi:hypothetical protein